jgi:HTH-type transcriptional regulator/antitoxin HipB
MEYHIRTLEQLRPILVGFRKQAGLSQTALASLLGVSQQSYAKIEANPSTTSIERLFKILSLLGADIILSERVPGATKPQPPRIARPTATRRALGEPTSASPSSGAEPIKNSPRKTLAAPPKLTPPSKKTERW